jgi:F-type H+-transporting ATPase subunit b
MKCSRGAVRYKAWLMRSSVAVVIALALVVIVAPEAWASGGGEEHHEVHFGKAEIFQIVNFILLICLLLYVYQKNAAGSFEKRSLEIQTAMEEAAKAKKAAEKKYLEYQTRVAQLDDEIGKIMELSRGDAEKERALIVEEAKKQAEKIVQQAELTAKHEVVLAKAELRREAAEIAAQMAADAVKRAAKPEDQRSWVKAYIDKIGEVQ